MVYRSVQLHKSEAARKEAESLVQQLEEELEQTEPQKEASEEIPKEILAEEPQGWQEAPVYDDPHYDAMKEVDLTALREVNPDVIGWIRIPGTQIDYPLMQGEDNQYYLERTWKGEPNAAGSIFLEQHCSADLSDFNTIIYGHRMKNGSMFAALKYYNKMDYLQEHPYVYILDDAGLHRYEVFSAYEASVTGTTYRLAIEDDEIKQKFIDDCSGWSVIETGVEPTIRDRMLTLSTCTGRGYETRWVVQAVLR
jgi:sortase B